ncbi:MAG: mechanosensitive ion channel family protein, partial [Solobacterium sp.]|nr:mechanosensitive ion channel family protein [Solobacterium sp.]
MENLIGIVITIVITAVLLAMSKSFFTRILGDSKLPLKFLHSTVNFIIIVIGVYAVLNQITLTKELSTTLLQSSTLIIAILTFAAQQTLGNIIAGFSLSFTHPVEIGHKVRIVSGGSVIAEGVIKDITIRHVVIQQYDGQTCIVPNSLVDSSVIVNTNYLDRVGNFLEFQVAYDTDLEKAKEIIHELLAKEKAVLNKDVKVYTSKVTDNGLMLKFTVWTSTIDESYITCSNLREGIVQEFLKQGIVIPYQTITVTEV